MEHCKFCQAELRSDSTVCPSCGRDNAEEIELVEKNPETKTVEEPKSEETPAEQPQAEPAQAAEEPQEPSQSGDEAQETAEDAEESRNTEKPQEQPEAPLSVPIQEGMKATPGKMALMIAGVVVLAALLVALIVNGVQSGKQDAAVTSEPAADPNASATIAAEPVETTEATIPADGNPDDVTCQGSYSVSDEEAESTRDIVVATMGDKQLTNAQLRVYYWMEVQGFLSNYGSYASYFGLDYTKPLDTQKSMEESGITWQQFFLQAALSNWQQVQAMAIAGEESGMKIAPENQKLLDELEDTVAQMAETYGVTNEELLKQNFGPGAGMEEYRNFQALYYQGLPYYTAETAKLVPEEDVLRAYFEEHQEDYASGGVTEDDMYVDVRHILITPEGGTTGEDGTTTYSDEEWETCRKKAQEALDQYLAGEQTEDAFAALATEKSQDPGSQANGGLYQRVYPGQMVQEFNDWCFDEARKSGDTGMVKTTYGYHVMYFVSTEPQWRYYAESDWTQEQTNRLIENLVEQHPVQIDYEKIALGVVNMGG